MRTSTLGNTVRAVHTGSVRALRTGPSVVLHGGLVLELYRGWATVLLDPIHQPSELLAVAATPKPPRRYFSPRFVKI